MININEAKRLIKRALLANLVSTKKDLAITPLISGKHGIGKSQMIKSIADDLNGYCITIEGGTLKEGEITGLPYQYKDENGNLKFKFLPYYAIERIQEEEKRLFLLNNSNNNEYDCLIGDENKYAMNNISSSEKIDLILNKKIKPVIIFIDEINRTENTVYKELMNILLTRSVNGYKFPWWVFFVGAMNPSTQNSVYSTNEMDPAQLDRFVKLKVSDNAENWLEYAKKANIDQDIIDFIKDNPSCLSENSKDLIDEEKPTPSPRGWDMVDTIVRSIPLLENFFTSEENMPRIVEKDLKNLIGAKVGTSVATMFLASKRNKTKALDPKDFFNDDEKLTKNFDFIKGMSNAKKVQSSNLIIKYLESYADFLLLDKNKYEKTKKQLSLFIELLDPSTRLLFGQNLTNAISSDGKPLIDLFFDVFEQDLLDTLDLNEQTKKVIAGK